MREEQADRVIELLEQLVAGQGGTAVEVEPEVVATPAKGKGKKGKAAAAPEPVSLDEARIKMKEFLDSQGLPAVKALLAEFEIAKLTDANTDEDPDIFAKIIARAEEIAAEGGDADLI